MAESQRRVHQCRSYLPGHTVHYLQAREAWRHPEQRRGGMVLSISGQAVEFEPDEGDKLQVFTHDPDHVARLIAALGTRAIYDPRWGLLRFEEPTRGNLVSVSTDLNIGPCSEEERGGTVTRPRDDEDAEEFTARVYAAITDHLHD